MKRIISIALIILTLANHMCFAVATHLCRGKVIASKVVISPYQPDCCGVNCLKSDHLSWEYELGKSPCCQNKYESLSGADYFKPEILSISRGIIEYLAEHHHVVPSIYYYSSDSTFSLQHYSPPVLDQDLPVLHQVFLM